MSTSDQRDPNLEGRRPRELETGEDTRSAEGYLSLATQTPLPLASQAVERRLVELLATIGHEFRTPLTVINGYTTTLLSRSQQLSSQEHEEFLQIIQQAGLHLEYLLARLFEIAELEAGNVSLHWSLVDLSAVARESIALAQRHVPEPLLDRFMFHLQCRDESGKATEQVPTIKGDERCVRKILGHLLENAVHYSPAGGRIDVIVRPAPQEVAAEGDELPRHAVPFLEICVCDLGLGIADEHLERIFEHFYRVDTTLTREAYGLGLGLTVCRHLVALHHGRIWAESCPNGGSAFHVWLPS